MGGNPVVNARALEGWMSGVGRGGESWVVIAVQLRLRHGLRDCFSVFFYMGHNISCDSESGRYLAMPTFCFTLDKRLIFLTRMQFARNCGQQ